MGQSEIVIGIGEDDGADLAGDKFIEDADEVFLVAVEIGGGESRIAAATSLQEIFAAASCMEQRMKRQSARASSAPRPVAFAGRVSATTRIFCGACATMRLPTSDGREAAEPDGA